MSSPPPPWESHPPLEEEGFYGAGTDADPDADTGPVHVVTPTDENFAEVDARDGDWSQSYFPLSEQDTFAGRFAGPLTIDPRTTPVKPERVRLGPIVAGVLGVLAIGLAAWLFWQSSDAVEPSNTASPTPTTTENPVDGEAQAKLLRLLPPGYPSSSCKQVDPPKDALHRLISR